MLLVSRHSCLCCTGKSASATTQASAPVPHHLVPAFNLSSTSHFDRIACEDIHMKVYSGSEIRNVALVGHNDTGKTTIVSQLLFDTGATTRMGRIEDGTTTTDFDQDEIDRKHSISAAVAYAEWKNTKINLLDTPGFGIFLMETRSAIRVADAAALVVSGVTGVEVTTEKVWKYAEEYELPRLVIVNKMDRERASFTRTLEALQKKFGKNVVPIQLPIGEEKDFKGVIDLVSMKAYVYPAD